MQIIYKVNDLLKAPEPCLLQQVNAAGRMGSGVAKAIMKRYPIVSETYHKEHAARGLQMGSVLWVDCRIFSDRPDNHLVGNIVGQKNCGNDGKLYTDYDALRAGLKEANRYLMNIGVKAAAMPLIGSGLGGGDWPTIAKIVEEELTDVQPVVYVLDESLLPDHPHE